VDDGEDQPWTGSTVDKARVYVAAYGSPAFMRERLNLIKDKMGSAAKTGMFALLCFGVTVTYALTGKMDFTQYCTAEDKKDHGFALTLAKVGYNHGAPRLAKGTMGTDLGSFKANCPVFADPETVAAILAKVPGCATLFECVGVAGDGTSQLVMAAFDRLEAAGQFRGTKALKDRLLDFEKAVSTGHGHRGRSVVLMYHPPLNRFDVLLCTQVQGSSMSCTLKNFCVVLYVEH
jgi:hypothetical protein